MSLMISGCATQQGNIYTPENIVETCGFKTERSRNEYLTGNMIIVLVRYTCKDGCREKFYEEINKNGIDTASKADMLKTQHF